MMMKRVQILLVLMAAALAGCASGNSQPAGELQIIGQVVEDVQPAVVTIRTFDPEMNATTQCLSRKGIKSWSIRVAYTDKTNLEDWIL